VKDLFEESRIGSIALRNRFVRSATCEGMCKADGTVPEMLVKLYSKLAEGGVGLLVTGIAGVNSTGKVTMGQMAMDTDELIPTMRNLVNSVHDLGARIVVQLGCGGERHCLGRSMTIEEIKKTVVDFGDAARRSKTIGFDGVQIYAADGYLISEYLSPYFNKRNDCYGGDLERRAKLMFDVYDEIRSAVGDDFPVMTRINCEDFREPGLKIDDCVYVCKEMSKKGVDAIEVSGGAPINVPDWIRGDLPVKTRIKTLEHEAYFYPQAKILGNSLGGKTPLVLAGGLRSLELIERILQEGIIDYFSLSRPLICEPDLVKRWQLGDRTKSKCTSCNECFLEAGTGSLRCSMMARHGKKMAGRPG
jgi:2,4-dienoyl-CoA reductase-like NADH-dependent reductase (Old Yellow Enzyme family)